MKNVNTIKRIALAVALFVSGLLIGCASTNSQAISVSNFDLEYENYDMVLDGIAKLYTDTETGVEYIVLVSSHEGIAITPRYNADGRNC